MTVRATWIATLVAAIAVVTAASAQPPRATPRDAIGPDDINRVGEWLKGMKGGQQPVDPALLKKAMEWLEKNPQLAKQSQEFLKNTPKPNPQQLEQFANQLKQSPALQDDAAKADLKQFLEKLGGLAPKGGSVPPMPDLGNLGKNGPPGANTPAPLTPLPAPGNPAGGTPFPNNPPVPPPAVPPPAPGVTPPPGGNPPGQPPMPRPPQGPPGNAGFNPQGKMPEQSGFPKGLEASNPQQQQYQKMAGWWEKNVGPLNDSPAVQQLIMDFASGSGSSSGQGGGLGDLLGDGKAGDSSLGKLADVNTGSSNWKFPDLGLGKLDFGGPSAPAMPSTGTPSAGSGPSFGDFGSGDGSWLPVVFLAVAAGGGLLLWWLWPKLAGGRGEPRPLFGLGPWPVDPRTIADRAALVKAFEYLSVLRCGTGAKVWNHVTIAAELRRAVPDVGDLSEPLARLYAVARYTPEDEPLAAADLAEARGHLCRLAGVAP